MTVYKVVSIQYNKGKTSFEIKRQHNNMAKRSLKRPRC